MSSLRINSLEKSGKRVPVKVNFPSDKISDFFGSNVFSEGKMKKFLSEEAYLSVMASIETGKKIDRGVADQVASAMKSWAMEKGATHYTHWFQPLTGSTAEKHDAFFELTGNGEVMETFSGNALVQQEPDASSFPNGGLRTTFEARGYTAWDPSSPAFIMEIDNGKTLCIPTIFIAYTGESLDYKAPLLKSQQALEHAALPVARMFDKNVNRVVPTLGWEQEYFLCDRDLFHARPDLVMSGRTVQGAVPHKGQQLDDHYFGSIPHRAYAFMLDFETEAHKLGIPVTTRHNEVAPNQFECAPIFEELNLAVDHNSLLMDLMDRVSGRHGLKVLFHEKPYAGINGSGKHNNWSMGTDNGKNLLSPGKTPRTNLSFLTFFVNTIKALHDYEDLLRASIASAGNDHRLGANEAPPAIISAFIGSNLTDVLNVIERRADGNMDELDNHDLKLDIHNKIPDLMLDNTDRNRTSPFAFTGNKFELRAVGSADNCASPMIVLNTIVAKQLGDFKNDVDALMKKGDKKDIAVLKILRKYIKSSKAIRFEGDNYSDAWEKEAMKRGLSNHKKTPEALDSYVSKKAVDLFTKLNIYTEEELHARYDIRLEKYTLQVQIESRVLGELALSHIIPTAIRYQKDLVDSVKALKEIGMPKSSMESQMMVIKMVSEHINGVVKGADAMIGERKKANRLTDSSKKANAYCKKVTPWFDKIRYHLDKLELLIEDKAWPLPKYRELLFVR